VPQRHGSACSRAPSAAALARRTNPAIDDRAWIVVLFGNALKAQDLDWLRDGSASLLSLDMARWTDVTMLPWWTRQLFSLTRVRATLAIAVICVACVACVGGDTAQGGGSNAAPASSATRASTDSATALRFDSIPQSVRDAIAPQAPAFTPSTPDGYSSSAKADARTSRDANMTVVRAHFRNSRSLDYILLGFDRRLHAIRIVAALVEPDGKVQVVGVSDGPERADSLAVVPDRYLELYVTSAAGATDLLVKPAGSTTLTTPERYAWDSNRRAFLIVSPGH
jgi:hypothetical protein